MLVMTRKVDELGRVVLPIEFRKALNIDAKCDLDMKIVDGTIVLSPKQTICRSYGAIISPPVQNIMCYACVKMIQEDK